MSLKPQAIVFDVYNTLFRNDHDKLLATFAEICSLQHLPIDAHTLWDRWKPLEMQFRKHRTNLEDPDNNPPFKSYETSWRECFQQVFNDLGKGDASVAAQMTVRNMGRQEPFTETLDMLRNLQPRIRTGIFSNADDAYLLPTLRRYDLQFEAVLSSEAIRVYKPHPRAFQQILGRMALAPEEAMYVGDQLYDDIMGAHKVGMTTVWINRNGDRPDPSLPTPHHTIENLTELLDLI